MGDEIFELVDDYGRVTGQAPRRQCHGDPRLRHRAVHVLVFRSTGELLLQLRSEQKDTCPGKWDSSVGGHIGVGETPQQAACRETDEELGIQGVSLRYCYRHWWRDARETELEFTYATVWDGPLRPDPAEVATVEAWPAAAIDAAVAAGITTPNFAVEWRLWQQWQRRFSGPDTGHFRALL